MPSTAATAIASAPAEPTLKRTVERVIHVVKTANGECFAWVESADGPIVGKFDGSLYDAVAGDLLGKAVWTIEPGKIVALQLSANGGSFSLRRSGSSWALASDQYVKLDAAKVEQFLADLADLKADKFHSRSSLDAGKYGLDKPARTFELTDSAGAVHTLKVAAKDATPVARAATADGVEGIFELPAAKLDLLEKTWKDFVVQEPTSTPADPSMGGRPFELEGR